MITNVRRQPSTSVRATCQQAGRSERLDVRRPSNQEEGWLAEYVGEYVFATANGRYEVHVVRRDAGAWAVRLGGFALHADGCFWTAPDAHPDDSVDRAEPTYPLDEAIARALRALARLP